jgi:hypothetical protein
MRELSFREYVAELEERERTEIFRQALAAGDLLQYPPKAEHDWEWWMECAIGAFSVLLFIALFGFMIGSGVYAAVTVTWWAALITLPLPLFAVAVSLRAAWDWLLRQ